MRDIGKFYIERTGPGGFIRRFQTVFMATWDGTIKWDKKEVAEIKWLSPAEIELWLKEKPGDFTKNFFRSFDLLKKALI